MISDTQTEIGFSCTVHETIPLTPGNDFASLYLTHVSGSLNIDWSETDLGFSASVMGELHLNALENDEYALPAQLHMSSADGVFAHLQIPNVLANRPPIDLGIARLVINNFQEAYLGYDMESEGWTFGMDLAVELEFPDFDGLRLPGLDGILLNHEGIHFPDFYFDEDDLAWLPQLELAGFGANLASFTLHAFTFPWFDWDGFSPGPWMFSFDFDLSTPDFASYLPECLRSLSVRVEDASFSGGSFLADLPYVPFEEDLCTISFGGGYEIYLSGLGGQLAGTADPAGFDMDGQLLFDGRLELGTPFTYDGPEEAAVSIDGMAINSKGLMEGEISATFSLYTLEIGPFSGGIDDFSVNFAFNDEHKLPCLQEHTLTSPYRMILPTGSRAHWGLTS